MSIQSVLMAVATKFTAFAAEVMTEVKEAGIDLAGKVATDVESEFEVLVGKVGKSATKFVADLFQDDSLSGLEKANLAATQLVQEASNQGITIAEQDVTAIIKNAYLAVKSEISKL